MPAQTNESLSALKNEVTVLEKALNILIDENASANEIRNFKAILDGKKEELSRVIDAKSNLLNSKTLNKILNETYSEIGPSSYIDALSDQLNGQSVEITGSLLSIPRFSYIDHYDGGDTNYVREILLFLDEKYNGRFFTGKCLSKDYSNIPIYINDYFKSVGFGKWGPLKYKNIGFPVSNNGAPIFRLIGEPLKKYDLSKLRNQGFNINIKKLNDYSKLGEFTFIKRQVPITIIGEIEKITTIYRPVRQINQHNLGRYLNCDFDKGGKIGFFNLKNWYIK